MMKSKVIKKVKTISIAAVILIMAAVIIGLFLDNQVEKNGHFIPSYGKLDIGKIVGDGIKKDEYQKLFSQTGLGKAAVDRIMKNDVNFVEELQKYQDDFFAVDPYKCSRITIITGEEQSVDEKGDSVNKFEIQGLEDGDVFISLSTHSLGWRHGHAAIVVDSVRGITLESMVLGEASRYQDYKKWELYPTFIQLRINKKALEKVGVNRAKARKMLIETARGKLHGVPYDLFAGIPVKYVENIDKTQCAHLVWYAYDEMGTDIDSDKGIFVTPYDMAHSDLLEIVQIYGVNPKDYMGDFN